MHLVSFLSNGPPPHRLRPFLTLLLSLPPINFIYDSDNNHAFTSPFLPKNIWVHLDVSKPLAPIVSQYHPEIFIQTKATIVSKVYLIELYAIIIRQSKNGAECPHPGKERCEAEYYPSEGATPSHSGEEKASVLRSYGLRASLCYSMLL